MIRALPPLLVSQIAAGEVIERPASVVKELVENSLDAGATRIDIAIESGGRELIRVADNGQGISADQLPLAVAPHATSKLSDSQSLALINTLGFRGEAMASIASVSRLRLTSRATVKGQIAEAGAVIEASGESVSPSRPLGCAPGTTVEVRDLFFHTPARRKFMRTASTEFGHIADIITRIAMAHPEITIRLRHGTRTVIDVTQTRSHRQRCVQLLGPELAEALLEFDVAETRPPEPADHAKTSGVTAWGLAGMPAIARSTGKFQYLSVNGRPVRDRNISHAVKEAYRGLIPQDKQPLVVVAICADPLAVDVNVHPAKTEVRFRDPARIHGLVMSAIRQRLLDSDLTPRATLSDSTPPSSARSHRPSAPPPSLRTSAPQADVSALSGGGVDRGPTVAKGLDIRQVKQSLLTEDRVATRELETRMAPSAARTGSPQQADEPDRSPTRIPATRNSVLQVHDTYLVTQDEQGLIIVDQHALHERVMFEELWDRLLHRQDDGRPKNLESQRLLIPVVVKVSPRRMALLDQLKPLHQRIGIEAEPIGPDAVAIHAFPSFLFDRNVDPGQFFEELLDHAEEGLFHGGGATNHADQANDIVEEAVLHKVLDMMACKAAIKAGQQMSAEEMVMLLAKREQVERASACPHGRPTTIRLTLRDMEKQFKRT